MEENILQRYIGKMVRIETDQQKHQHRPYVGKIAEYNIDFIRLNPYAIQMEGYSDPSIEDMQKHEVGSTNLEILLGRRVIASLKKVVV